METRPSSSARPTMQPCTPVAATASIQILLVLVLVLLIGRLIGFKAAAVSS